MNISWHVDLKPYNTFGISVFCDYFVQLTEVEQLSFIQEFLRRNPMPFLFVGEGSNLLFLNDFHGLVILNNLKGIREITFENDRVIVEAFSGEIWDDFVNHCVTEGWGGVENLAYIPGTVGASAVQNIGAYGIEAKETIYQVFAKNILTGERFAFSNNECRFDYRYSIFKQEKNRSLFITKVRYQLTLKPEVYISYGVIEQELAKRGIIKPKITDIRETVTAIRKAKLPDVKLLGSAGSFFKNPVVDASKADSLKKEFSKAPFYPVDNGKVKLAAGWLIEKCGLKGYRKGDAGIHEKQALVLVNYGNATGKEIFELSQLVQKTVFDTFGIELEREVVAV